MNCGTLTRAGARRACTYAWRAPTRRCLSASASAVPLPWWSPPAQGTLGGGVAIAARDAAASATAACCGMIAGAGPGGISARSMFGLSPPDFRVATGAMAAVLGPMAALLHRGGVLGLASLDDALVFMPGKNSRKTKKANHNARPCSHIGRKYQRHPKKFRVKRKRWMGKAPPGSPELDRDPNDTMAQRIEKEGGL